MAVTAKFSALLTRKWSWRCRGVSQICSALPAEIDGNSSWGSVITENPSLGAENSYGKYRGSKSSRARRQG